MTDMLWAATRARKHKQRIKVSCRDLYGVNRTAWIALTLGAMVLGAFLALIACQTVYAEDAPLYIVTIEPDSRLNLRAEPNTDSKVLARLYNGMGVQVDELSEDGQWGKADCYGGQVTGWVCMAYLTPERRDRE